MNEITRAAFSAATSFHEAAIRCLPSQALPSIAPLAMSANIAFACELYIKVHLIGAGQEPRGHSLRKLFEALSTDERQEIETKYSNGLTATDRPFVSALAEVSNAFIDWRYVYEREHSALHIGALWRLARVLFDFTDRRYHDPDMPEEQRTRLSRS